MKNITQNNESYKISEWLKCKKYALEIGFTEQEIEQAIQDAKLTIDDLTDKTDYEQEPRYYSPRELLKDYHNGKIRVTEMSHKYRGTVMEGWKDTRVQTWRVPAQYQGLKHNKFVYALLKNRFSWFDKFQWHIYEWNNDSYEIYLQVEQGKDSRMLYVPVKCLVNSDKDGIIERNTEYWNGYYNNRPEDLKKMLGTMDTEKAQEFFTLLEVSHA